MARQYGDGAVVRLTVTIPGGRNRWGGIFLLSLFLLLSSVPVRAGDAVVFYRVGERDVVAWNLLRKYMEGKGYEVTMYEGAQTIEKQMEAVNRINRVRAGLCVALDAAISGEESCFVGVTRSRRPKGSVLSAEEVGFLHADQSRKCARAVAGMFNRKVVEFPIFPLLGVDMPAIYLRLRFPQEKATEVLDKVHGGLQKYFSRGSQDEK